MLAAILGLLGVLVGALLTQMFAASSEWRGRRLDAMVGVAPASGRVIGAHERLYELFQGDGIPLPTDAIMVAALEERFKAHHEWRSARCRLEIVMVDDENIYEAMNRFDSFRGAATPWIVAYMKNDGQFRFSAFEQLQTDCWYGMRKARWDLMAFSRRRSQQDSHLVKRVINQLEVRRKKSLTKPQAAGQSVNGTSNTAS